MASRVVQRLGTGSCLNSASSAPTTHTSAELTRVVSSSDVFYEFELWMSHVSGMIVWFRIQRARMAVAGEIGYDGEQEKIMAAEYRYPIHILSIHSQCTNLNNNRNIPDALINPLG